MKNIFRLSVFNEEDIIFIYIWSQKPENKKQRIEFIRGLYYGKEEKEHLFCFAAAKFQHLIIL